MVRLRPLNERESNNTAARRCLEVVDQASLQYTGRDAPANNHFGFDRVYGEQCTQEEAFEVRQGTGRAGHGKGDAKEWRPAPSTAGMQQTAMPPYVAFSPCAGTDGDGEVCAARFQCHHHGIWADGQR